MALPITIAEAVVTELNAGSFSRGFTATRRYVPKHELDSLADLTVTVVPKSLEITGGTRAVNQHDCEIDVAVQQRVAADAGLPDSGDADTLMDLVTEIEQALRMKPLNDLPTAHWVRSANNPIYSVEHLEQAMVFTSVLTFTFRVLQ